MIEQPAEYVIARAAVEAAIPRYRSAEEAVFASAGQALLFDEFGVTVAAMLYEPLAINLPGGRYTPDFLALLADGRVVFIEVKASKKQRGYRDARSKLRAAARLHSWFTWLEARVTLRRGELCGVELEVINV